LINTEFCSWLVLIGQFHVSSGRATTAGLALGDAVQSSGLLLTISTVSA
jgi:hypothetical protein